MLKPRWSNRRRAFSIGEMVASVAILAILAGIVVPSVARYLYEQKIEATAALLDSLSAAKMAFQKAITVYPGHLSHLTTLPTALVDESDCNGVGTSTPKVLYTAGQMNFWSGGSTPVQGHSGPYFGRVIPKTGFPIGIGTANDQMWRTSANATAGFLMILVPGVPYADAKALNDYMDGSGIPGPNRTDTAGAVRWSTTPSGALDLVTLLFFMGIRNAC